MRVCGSDHGQLLDVRSDATRSHSTYPNLCLPCSRHSLRKGNLLRVFAGYLLLFPVITIDLLINALKIGTAERYQGETFGRLVH